VRKPDGETVVERFSFISLAKRYKFLSIPVIRGAINLWESLTIGYKALIRSAQIAENTPPETDGKVPATKNKIAYAMSFFVAFVSAIGIFMYLPMFISQLFFKDSVIGFNAFAGVIRIILFLLYLIVISFWKDIRRVFEYHGAEHKAIFTFEDGKELSLENMRPYATMHPRCGTSFLLLVAGICIFLFSIIDALVTACIAPYPNVLARFFVHLALIPVVSGLSYEVLRLSDRFQDVPVVRVCILPGLWLQKITTREPDDSQLRIAASALKASL
jgi:uncharacterized protein YqhQ